MWTTGFSSCLLLALFLGARGIKLGSFNIRQFGRAKMGKPDVVRVLLQVAERYDILLVQEIQDASGTAINNFLNQLNRRPGNDYSMVISPRVGRSNQKEQYAFLYRNGIGVSIPDTYTYDDGEESHGNDTFEREPYVVKLSSRKTAVKDIVLIACHTRPRTARYEIDTLKDVYDDAIRRWGIRNVLILGDLNADCTYVPKSAWKNIRLRTDGKFSWLIGDDIDTTVKDTHCAYDRFVASGATLLSSVVGGSVQVYDFKSRYGLTQAEAEAVSDHFPIELELTEVTRNVVSDKNGGSRLQWTTELIITAMGAWLSRQ